MAVAWDMAVIVRRVQRAIGVVQTRATFLWVIYAIPAVSVFLHAIAPDQPFFKGQDLGILSSLALTGLAVLLWGPYRRNGRWSRPTLAFLLLLTTAWAYQVVRTQLDQSVFTLAAFCLPVALLLVMTKAAPRHEFDSAMLALAYSILVVCVASLVFGRLGWMPDGFTIGDAGGLRFSQLSWLGIPGRWSGPFGSVNLVSPVGALILVFGATRHGWHRVVLVLGGLLILALGQSRSAIIATAAGLLVVVLWSPAVERLRHAVILRWTCLGAAAVATVLYVARIDPTFNGRTPIWTNFLGLLRQNPPFGVGESGIVAFVVEMSPTPGFIPHQHAHSVLFDATTRYGLVMAVLTLAIFALAIAAGIRGLRHHGPASLAVVVFVIVAGLTETIHSWAYWSTFVAALVWAVAVALEPDLTHAASDSDAPVSLSLPNA